MVLSTFDSAGRLASEKIDGALVATPAYDGTTGELATVAYGNGTSLSRIAKDGSGRMVGLTWSLNGASVTNDVLRSQDGSVLSSRTVDGASLAGLDAYSYDSVGRLASAASLHHALTYSFAGSSGCGASATAGLNTNRTAMSDSTDGGAPVSTTYCYDRADRLTSSSGALALTPSYDAQGNTRTLGSQTLVYDGGNRHVGTDTTANTHVAYTRDVSDRLVQRVLTGATTGTQRYSYSAAGDSPDITLSGTGALLERSFTLPGGVLLTKTSTVSGDVWSYPNIHGDITAVASSTGAKQGAAFSYDPFGQPMSAAGAVSKDSVPDNAAGKFEYGWLGQHQRGYEHEGSIATIEMGARQYVPQLGRFLQVDPMEGGSANDYDYSYHEPINSVDLDGAFVFAIPVIYWAVAAVITYVAADTAVDYYRNNSASSYGPSIQSRASSFFGGISSRVGSIGAGIISISRKTKERIRQRDGDTCQLCGQGTTRPGQSKRGVRPSNDESNIDHKYPRSRGGLDDDGNLQNTCRSCNLRKGAHYPYP